MKLNTILFKQHIGWHFKNYWRIQGKRIPRDTGALQALAAKGIPVYKPEDIFAKEEIPQLEEVPDYIPKPTVFDKTHPNWHERICYTYKDNNVLLEGLDQAKIITNTVELHDGLPSQIKLEKAPTKLDKIIRKIILNSHILDAEQVKLPKRKDPERPAWNFPRDYGVCESRVMKLLISKLIQAIESCDYQNIAKQRHLIHDLHFWYPFEKDGDLIQLQLRGDSLLTSSKPLSPIIHEPTLNFELPNIEPIKLTNTLNKENIYNLQNVYPIENFISKRHPHTVFVHFNYQEVKNIYEEEVTEPQFFGRSLMKAFTVAATYAKQTFGDEVKKLPNPVNVQCIQTDGRIFHFGILQLNTLDTEENSIRNVWHQTPRMPLFDSCTYHSGKPILEGYNNEVISHLMAFYKNS
ncbi:hypothetical protein FQR65_LT06331 [Abscondita terminalis]|nr:hypothetical protein FQR65_LT06331 [Abscondita terminalis]